MIEAVLVTYHNDFSLAKICLRSLALYCPDITKIHVIIDEKDIPHWKSPDGIQVMIYAKEALWPGNIPYPSSAYHAQKILKLLCHQFVQSEYIWMLDSDMLLTSPLSNEKLGLLSKPMWFYAAWNQGNQRWKAETEAFLGFTMPYSFMEDPLYIFKRSVLLDFLSKYRVQDFLRHPNASEYEAYGAFAYAFHREAYAFTATSASRFAKCMHQVPPTYLVLDEKIGWQEYQESSLLAVWSAWSQALSKMIACYHDSQQQHFAEIRDYCVAHLEDYVLPDNSLHPRCIEGCYLDQWVKSTVNITVPVGVKELALAFETPKRAKPVCDILLNNAPLLHTTLLPGAQMLCLAITNPKTQNSLSLRFSGKKAWTWRDRQRALYTRLLRVVGTCQYTHRECEGADRK